MGLLYPRKPISYYIPIESSFKQKESQFQKIDESPKTENIFRASDYRDDYFSQSNAGTTILTNTTDDLREILVISYSFRHYTASAGVEPQAIIYLADQSGASGPRAFFVRARLENNTKKTHNETVVLEKGIVWPRNWSMIVTIQSGDAQTNIRGSIVSRKISVGTL